MKHVDFTKVVIFDLEGARIRVLRLDVSVGPHQCECCGERAEYTLRSDWDELGQCDVYECQGCLLTGMGSPESPDTYVILVS